MLYQAYESRRRMLAPLFGLAGLQSGALRWMPRPLASLPPVRGARALIDTLSALELTHRRPDFGIDSIANEGIDVPVSEETVTSMPFGTLVRFAKDVATSQPRVLVVPGLAGHFATLIRGTVSTLLRDHEVFVADWHNARDVPVREGRFGLDEYIDHLIEFLTAAGPGTHLMAVCQPCVPALAAAALMAADNHPAQPQSVIMMAGPVDSRINPGPVNEFATRWPLDVLERSVITTVPRPHKGAGRRVYPGFLQVIGFMSMSPGRHLSAFGSLFRDLAVGHEERATKTRTFYEEYFSVLDVTAEFYLDTASAIFRDHDLACNRMFWRGRKVEPESIRTALLTIEAENDEICPPGQTQAAHALCVGIPTDRKRHHLQPGVGHYGVFSGSRFEQEIYPEIKRFVADAQRAHSVGVDTHAGAVDVVPGDAKRAVA
jgi:polyhydroxyalkanoate depolymerase